MSESDRPRSPFAGMADLAARAPIRVLSPDEIEQMLAQHRLYLETEYHQGHRANFSSADLTGRDFSGLYLRGIKMDRALLSGADFTGATLQSANLIGALRPCGFIAGASKWGKPCFGQSRERVPCQGRYGVRIDGQRGAARRLPR
jgi:Pentapeptide repeats (8 copies)